MSLLLTSNDTMPRFVERVFFTGSRDFYTFRAQVSDLAQFMRVFFSSPLTDLPSILGFFVTKILWGKKTRDKKVSTFDH